MQIERALELIEAKKQADAARLIRDFTEVGIRILNGRFGPYVTDGTKNGRIPKETDPLSLTLEDCQQLLLTAKPAFGRGRAAAAKAKPATKTAKDAASKAAASGPDGSPLRAGTGTKRATASPKPSTAKKKPKPKKKVVAKAGAKAGKSGKAATAKPGSPARTGRKSAPGPE